MGPSDRHRLTTMVDPDEFAQIASERLRKLGEAILHEPLPAELLDLLKAADAARMQHGQEVGSDEASPNRPMPPAKAAPKP